MYTKDSYASTDFPDQNEYPDDFPGGDAEPDQDFCDDAAPEGPLHSGNPALDAAHEYIDRGWAVVPVGFQKKRPYDAKWQDLRIGHDEAEVRFGNGPMNVGVILGDCSCLVDVDLDCDEAVQLADTILPATGAVFGRESRPGSHRLYCVAPGTADDTKRHQFPNGGVIVEFRANGAQTVFPGSVHESGEYIRWDEHGEPAFVDANVLRERVECLAEACRQLRGNTVSDSGPTGGTRPQQEGPKLPIDPPPAPQEVVRRCTERLHALPQAISKEGGHNATFRATCECARYGLSLDQAEKVMSEWNESHCNPPWSSQELGHKIATAYERVAAEGQVGIHGSRRIAQAVHSEHSSGPLQEFSMQELAQIPPDARPILIEGICRVGAVVNLIGPPKARKTWAAHALAIAVATGGYWFGRACTQGRVLIVDNELYPDELADRLRTITRAKGIDLHLLGDQIRVLPIHGKCADIHQIAEHLLAKPSGEFSLVVVDALYLTLPEGTDENSNSGMTHVYAVLAKIAAHTNAAILVTHHAAKGNSAGRSATDMGAGAGAISRAATAHLTMRPHQEEGVVILDQVVRGFKPAGPSCWKFEFPLFVEARTADPLAVAVPVRAKPSPSIPAKPAKKKRTPQEFVDEFLREEPQNRAQIEATAGDEGMSKREIANLLQLAEGDGLCIKNPGRPGCPATYVRRAGGVIS